MASEKNRSGSKKHHPTPLRPPFVFVWLVFPYGFAVVDDFIGLPPADRLIHFLSQTFFTGHFPKIGVSTHLNIDPHPIKLSPPLFIY